ncbi:hypothetical protein BG015_002456 [Linnemannia schmuckeri]|uniref:Arb2 domain-containing protein n=1 Tax=Linnemannia schmuckeri TaxID=64567 RepID=A0A9P5S320_9FUNG|nr:hypothetical protein BG015_002456 [Linnemannia schmuckeri]
MTTSKLKNSNPKPSTNCCSEKNNNTYNIKSNKRDASQEPKNATITKKKKTTNNTSNNNADEEVVQEPLYTPTTTNSNNDYDTTIEPLTVATTQLATTTSATATKKSTRKSKTTNVNGTPQKQQQPGSSSMTSGNDEITTAIATDTIIAQPTPTTQPTIITTATKKNVKKSKPSSNNYTDTSPSQQESLHTTTFGNDDTTTTTQSTATSATTVTTTQPTTTSSVTRLNTRWIKTVANNNNDNTPQTTTKGYNDTTAEPTITTITTATAIATATTSKKNNKKIIPVIPTKKDKHIIENSGMRIITPYPDPKSNQGSDHTLPPTPPVSASASDESSENPNDEIDSLKGYTDEEWFSLMGWHFSENSDHDFVDKHGKLFNYEDHFDRFEFVQAKIQSLVYDRLKDKYGFERIAVAQNKGTSAPGGGDHHRFPRIFVSPDARTNSTILVLVPKVGEESPGQWDKDLFTTGEKGNFLFASQFPYIDMALEHGWGVVLCDPNGGDLHDSGEYRESHVQYVWDDIVHPSSATCVMYVAFGEGTDAVFSILDGSRAAEFRERVKAVALLDGSTGDKRKEKLDRAWLNKHARSFMARNGASPGRNGTKVNAAEEHELVPGFALQAVFAFLTSQHGLFTKTQTLAQPVRKSSSTNSNPNGMPTSNSNSVQKPDSIGSRNVRHDRKVMRLQNQKGNRINNNSINAMMNNNTIAAAARSNASGEPRRGRGRPRKLK